MRRAMAGVAALALALAGCAEVTAPEGADARLRTDVVPDGSWTVLERPGFGGGRGFSMAVPPGYEATAAQPIDSDAASFVRGGAHLMYDFGPWSAASDAPMGATEVVAQRIRVGGRVARVLAYRYDGARVVEAVWRDVGVGAGGPNHLLVRGAVVTEADRAELLAAVYSVRFDP